MALSASLSNNSLSAPPRLTSSSSSSSKPTKTLSLHSLHHRPILGFPLISSINNKTRPSFKSSFTINGMEGVQNDVKASESEADLKHVSNLKKLIKAYKSAIYYEDEKTISDIEARISVIDNEKNELLEKVSTLSAEITSGKEKFIRLQADFDNFRKRLEKERLNIRSDAQGELMESLLVMVDSFERAKQQIKPETEMEKKIDTSYQGIYKQFVEIMRSLKVAAVPTVGKPFDPTLHEAIAREESVEFKEGIVIEEFRRGFLLGDRLLRPATVKVSAGPGRKKATGTSEKSAEQTTAAAVIDER
ncbi:hypothetical protein LWI28_020431 [Acer negundo]|uniref:GrpE protein homolog n=1 Tax=Acer negundo TaxID=4023 RepID=A0AAD5P7K0_ACENE|nr:hypothetical protein LWI28_020431 [Acer negundo]KAK4859568.1 hypothetical protein QYF36_007798 [Acer negundo]